MVKRVVEIIEILLVFFIAFILNTSYALSEIEKEKNRLMGHTKQDKMKNMMSFINQRSIRPVIKQTWGEGIPELFAAAPVTALMIEEEPEKERASVNMRRMPSGTIVLQSADNTLSILTADGLLFETLQVPSPSVAYQNWRIIDFALDEEENIYLLEIIQDDLDKTFNLFRKINEGTEAWYVKEKVDEGLYNYQSFNTKYQDFFVLDKHLYVCASHDKTFSIFEVEKNTGKLKLFHELAGSYERVFMDSKNHIYYVKEKEIENEKDQRYWVQYAIDGNKENFRSRNDEMYELLGHPVAVDDYGRGYGVFGYEMGCINDDDTVAWRVNLENIVYVAATEDIYTSNFISENNESVVQIDMLKGGAIFEKQIILKIPPSLIERYNIKNWRLIYVSEDGKFHVSGFNSHYYDPQDNIYKYKKILITYDSVVKEIENINHEPIRLYEKEYKLQGANSWEVDENGNLYLPVLGTDKFYVFKITGV